MRWWGAAWSEMGSDSCGSVLAHDHWEALPAVGKAWLMLISAEWALTGRDMSRAALLMGLLRSMLQQQLLSQYNQITTRTTGG